MCCLFGLIDYGHRLDGWQKRRMLSILAAECEARGTDATGIAYNSQGQLRIFKRPLPAHMMRFKLPSDVHTVMGHTRMTTQGSPRRNRNNHPFYGNAGRMPFALAHNGVIYNDLLLRRELHLPQTRVETDSFIGVQLLEQKRALNFDSLRYMAEQLEGSFSFSVLDADDNLFLVKGDNPLYLLHFPKFRLYLYASTEAILQAALRKMERPRETPCRVPLECGEILRIDAKGGQQRDTFDDSKLLLSWFPVFHRPYSGYQKPSAPKQTAESRSYLEEIKSVAMAYGYAPEQIDALAAMGFTPEELEEMLYSGEW